MGKFQNTPVWTVCRNWGYFWANAPLGTRLIFWNTKLQQLLPRAERSPDQSCIDLSFQFYRICHFRVTLLPIFNCTKMWHWSKYNTKNRGLYRLSIHILRIPLHWQYGQNDYCRILSIHCLWVKFTSALQFKDQISIQLKSITTFRVWGKCSVNYVTSESWEWKREKIKRGEGSIGAWTYHRQFLKASASLRRHRLKHTATSCIMHISSLNEWSIVLLSARWKGH